MPTKSTATACSASSSPDQSAKMNLSLYEQSRTVQQLHPDDFEIKIPDNDDDDELKALFKCAICEELLVKSMTSVRCAHRFCEKCLLNSKDKQCPKCEVKIVGQECRYDSRMDSLIRTIYPEADKSGEQTPPTEPKGLLPLIIAPYDNQSRRCYLKLAPNCPLSHLRHFIKIKNESRLDRANEKRVIIYHHQADSEQLTPINDENRSIAELYQDEDDDQVLELFFDFE